MRMTPEAFHTWSQSISSSRHRPRHSLPPFALLLFDVLKGDKGKILWHPKRATNTPNHGLRWIKEESAWRYSDENQPNFHRTTKQ
ncbi:MAG: hypothetical protein ACJ788_24095 [Ktedonobacteraceae bacterium]